MPAQFENWKFFMKVIVSFTVLLCALTVILCSNRTTVDKKWAYGVVGMIVGYWLNSG
jgi:hypothetical protein